MIGDNDPELLESYWQESYSQPFILYSPERVINSELLIMNYIIILILN